MNEKIEKIVQELCAKYWNVDHGDEIIRAAMRELAQRVRRETLEEAAMVCDGIWLAAHQSKNVQAAQGAEQCVMELRRLAREPQEAIAPKQ